MLIDSVIAKAFPALGKLAEFLKGLAEKHPESADLIAPKVEALESAADADGLLELGTISLKELAKVPSEGLSSRFHPSD